MNRADSRMDDTDLNLIKGQFDQRILDGFDGPLNICFDDNIQVFDFTFHQLFVQLFKAHPAGPCKFLGALLLKPMFTDLFGILLRRHDVEFIACHGNTGQADDLYGNGRTGFFDLSAHIVVHDSDFSIIITADNRVPYFKGSFSDQNGCHRADSGVQSGFNNVSGCELVWVCF